MPHFSLLLALLRVDLSGGIRTTSTLWRSASTSRNIVIRVRFLVSINEQTDVSSGRDVTHIFESVFVIFVIIVFEILIIIFIHNLVLKSFSSEIINGTRDDLAQRRLERYYKQKDKEKQTFSFKSSPIW